MWISTKRGISTCSVILDNTLCDVYLFLKIAYEYYIRINELPLMLLMNFLRYPRITASSPPSIELHNNPRYLRSREIRVVGEVLCFIRN